MGSRTQDISGLSRQCSATELQQPDNHQPSQCVCTVQVGLNASVCAVRTLLGVNWKILSIRKEPMLSGFLTLNAKSTLPHARIKEFRCYEAKSLYFYL